MGILPALCLDSESLSVGTRAGCPRKLADFTRTNVGKRIGIVLNGKLVSAPTVHAPIVGVKMEMSGSLDEGELEARTSAGYRFTSLNTELVAFID